MPLSPAIGFPSNCGKLVGSQIPNWVFDKPRLLTNRFRLVATQINRLQTVASSTNVVVSDKNIIRSTGSSLITDFLVNVEFLIPNFFTTTSIISGNTNVLSNPINGLCSAVNTGSTYLQAIGEDGSVDRVDVNISNIIGTTSDALSSYVTGSAAKNTSDNIDNRISGKNPSTTKNIFSAQNHTSSIYTRNTNCWTGNINTTCISPWNSTGGSQRAGTLISPRHVIFCEHLGFYPKIGATIRFVDNSNNVINRTLINSLSFSGGWPDFRIGLLDSDVPNSISFAKILPSNWSTYFPSLSTQYTVPLLVIDQEEKALVTDWCLGSTSIRCCQPTNAQRLSFYENLISGDSGNPIFLVINNELILISVVGGGGAGSGSSLAFYKNEVNALMTALGGSYQLTEINLGSFNSY
jgi:hypothetical protein